MLLLVNIGIIIGVMYGIADWKRCSWIDLKDEYKSNVRRHTTWRVWNS